ncbi:MAG: hypothetical protein K8S14_02515 [Actinomycetia bacterium]|nr:hypothetical protein [Actinomycetes bacterium]
MKPDYGQEIKQKGDVLKALFFFDDWLLHAREGLDRKQGQCSLLKEVNLGAHPELSSIYALRFYYDKWLDRYVMYVDCTHKYNKKNQSNFTFRLDTDDLCDWPVPEWTSGSGPLWDRVKNPVLDQNGNPMYYFDVLCLADTPLAEKGYFMNIYDFMDRGKSIGPVIAFSRDGLNWEVDIKTRWIHYLSDTCNPSLYNPRTGQFMISCRPEFVDRRAAFIATTDMKTFSTATTVLQPDAEDPVCREFYGLNPIFYDDIFVGVLQIYDTEPTENAPFKMLGTNEVQLAYSYNGQNWYRASRQPFFARTEPGTASGGCAYLGTPVLTRENRIVFCLTPSWVAHDCGKDLPEGYNPIPTYLYDMRLDGFVYLKTRARQGMIKTKTVISHGGELTMNVRTTPTGHVKVAVLDGTLNADTFGEPLPNYTLEDAIPVSGDEIFGKACWRNRNNLDELKGRSIMLQVHVCEGELYALRFPYQVGLAMRYSGKEALPARWINNHSI